MKKLKKIIIAYLPPTLWATMIFLLSSQSVLPGFEESPHDFIFKKTAHIVVYLVLYLLLKRATDITIKNKSSKKHLFIPILICLIYAVSDEFHQSLVPGRYATLRDIGYDMLGVGTAFLRKYDFI
jgi:VanZ family protein